MPPSNSVRINNATAHTSYKLVFEWLSVEDLEPFLCADGEAALVLVESDV